MRQPSIKTKEEVSLAPSSSSSQPSSTNPTNPPVPPPSPNQQSYSSTPAQIIQSLANLLTTVNRDTLVIFLLFGVLVIGCALAYRQIDKQIDVFHEISTALNENTATLREMKGILQSTR